MAFLARLFSPQRVGNRLTAEIVDRNLDRIKQSIAEIAREYREHYAFGLANYSRMVANYRAARRVAGASGMSILVAGRTAARDGGEGAFTWDATITPADDDDASILAHTSGSGGWRRSVESGYFDVAWFGRSNANYYNASDGKWYRDSGYTNEADDDAWKFQAVNDLLVAGGGGTAYFGPGNWYFKTKQSAAVSTDRGNEFVRTGSNITWRGAGRDVSFIRLAPGLNESAYGGYSVALGYFDSRLTPDTVQNVRFEHFTVDQNGHKNQFYTSINTLAFNFLTNRAVCVSAGTNIHLYNVGARRVSGVYTFSVGEYGSPQYTKDFSIRSCYVSDFCYDGNVTDASYITCGGNRGVIGDNIVAGTVSADSSINFYPWTAYELHGTGLAIGRNVAERMVGGFNLAADSREMEDVVCNGNVIRECSAGINLFQYNGWSLRRVKISNNTFERCWFVILSVQDPATLGGAGLIQDLSITDNIGVSSPPGIPANWGISVMGNSSGSGGIEIARNKLYGFTAGGIRLATTQANGLIEDAAIVDNTIEQCIGDGIYITSPSGDAAANFSRLRIDGNRTINDLGTMPYGVLTDAWLDTNCIIGRHSSIGHTSAEILVSTGTYAASDVAPYTISASCSLGGVGLSGGRIQGAATQRPDDAGVAFAPGNGYSSFYGRMDYYNPAGTALALQIDPADKVATTDATVTILKSITINDNSALSVMFVVCAYRTGGARGTGAVGDTAKFVRRATVKRVAGTITILATETIGTDQLDADLTAAAVAVSVASPGAGVISVRGSGAVGLNLSWQAVAYVESLVS